MTATAEVTFYCDGGEVAFTVPWIDEATSVGIAAARLTRDWSLDERMCTDYELVGVRVLT